MLDARIEGWIVGLQLIALSMQGQADVAAFVESFGGGRRFVLDYLAEEVIDRQPLPIQDFLLKTSILERMCGPLCDALTGRDDGREMLVRLDRANLFLIPMDDERRWYRYHHLFADLLHSCLRQTWPDLAPAPHRRAGAWYENAGLVEEAVAHTLVSGDMERAVRLVEQHAGWMVTHGKLVTFSRWLEALPDDLIGRRPWLCVYHAWSRYWVGLRDQVEECLQRAERGLWSQRAG